MWRHVSCNLEAAVVNATVLLPLSQRQTDLQILMQPILVCYKHASKMALQPPWAFRPVGGREGGAVRVRTNQQALPVLQATRSVQSQLVPRFIAASQSRQE